MERNKKNIIEIINKELTEIPASLNSELTINNKKFNERDELKELKEDIDKFLEGDYFQRYILLPGIRNVGKTTMLFQLYDYLYNEKNIPANQILYISLEDFRLLTKLTLKELVELFLENEHNTTLRLLDKKIFLLIDEANYDPTWSLSGKIIFDKTKNIFMVFTGSSALNFEYNADSARRLYKKNIIPLNYREHIKLKYNLQTSKMSKALENILYDGNVDDAINCEREVNNVLNNTLNYTPNTWNTYLKYGGFPESINHRDYDKKTIINIIDIVEKIIYKDMPNIKNITSSTQVTTQKILRFLASKPEGEVSFNGMANLLDASKSNIRDIFEILEKTHLIFHLEPYGNIGRRITHSWKYYFATSSIKNALATFRGNSIRKNEEYEGSLIENHVASTLFNYTVQNPYTFNICLDSSKKKNVDFIIYQDFETPIPIEVGRGKKDKKQIKTAINKYNSEYGLIISNTTNKIEKEDNIIYIPLKTFSFL